MSTRRRPRTAELGTALDAVHDGATIAVGGLWFHNAPSAAVRELVRRGAADLTLFGAPPSSFTTDLLVGAGAVRRALIPHVSFEHLGLAPNVRRAVERGELELVECDEATLLGGLMATLEGLPEHPVTSLKGTDHLRSSPLAVPATTSEGLPIVAPPALTADVALLHAQEADEFGNVRHLGAPFCDPVLAKAARTVVVTVDRLVSNDDIRSSPGATTLPAYLVDAVVPLEGGAHPCSSHGLYPHDEEHLRSYLALAGEGALDRYLERWVTGPRDHADYLAAIGGPERLAALEAVA
jgi:glutaconate CoA-transferase subunit A